MRYRENDMLSITNMLLKNNDDIKKHLSFINYNYTDEDIKFMLNNNI